MIKTGDFGDLFLLVFNTHVTIDILKGFEIIL